MRKYVLRKNNVRDNGNIPLILSPSQGDECISQVENFLGHPVKLQGSPR